MAERVGVGARVGAIDAIVRTAGRKHEPRSITAQALVSRRRTIRAFSWQPYHMSEATPASTAASKGG
jgi:hypothetical protein